MATAPPTPKAHGRLARVAPVVRLQVDAGDPCERFVAALVERAVARKVGSPHDKRNAKARGDRARAALVAIPGGLDEARRIAVALQSSGGAVLRAVERSHAEVREYAARAAVRFVAITREHDVRGTAALAMLASGAQWSAFGELLREKALAMAPGDVALADVLKLAERASAASRLDVLTALQLERQSRDARDADARTIDPHELARRVAQLRAHDHDEPAPPAAEAPHDEAQPTPVRYEGDDQRTPHEGAQEQDEPMAHAPDDDAPEDDDEPRERPYVPPPAQGETTIALDAAPPWHWFRGQWHRPGEPTYAEAAAAVKGARPAASAVAHCAHRQNPAACLDCHRERDAAHPRTQRRAQIEQPPPHRRGRA